MRHPLVWLVSVGIIAGGSVGSAQTADQVARGTKLFGEHKCSMCHSIAGKGNPKGQLNDVGARLSATDIREWLVDPEAMRKKHNAERRPLMKSYSTLPKEDLDALVAYMQSLKTK